jgi:HPt (histidine-containing phosphotransfer) domain-containing protein
MLDESVIESIRELEADGSPGLLNMLVTAFVEDVTTRLAQLRTAIDETDSRRIKEAAHSIKGMSGAMGAVRMSALSLDLEHRALADGESRALVDALEAEFGRVQTALSRAAAAPAHSGTGVAHP